MAATAPPPTPAVPMGIPMAPRPWEQFDAVHFVEASTALLKEHYRNYVNFQITGGVRWMYRRI